MDALSSENTGNFAKKAALASLLAPVIATVAALALHPMIQGHRLGLMAAGLISVVLIVAGLILGIIGLAGRSRHGTESTLWQGLVGTLVNGFIFLCMLPLAPMILTGQWYGSPAVPGVMHTFDQNGVQFSYDDGWRVTANPGAANGNHASEQITIQRRNNDAAICISLYPKASQLLDLEGYGRKLIQTTGGSADAHIVPIQENIGGVNQPGLRLHFSSLRESGLVFTGDGDFYRLQTAKHEIVVDTLTRGNAETIASLNAILATVKIDGDSGGYLADTPITGNTTAPTPITAVNQGFFIPATKRVDMVHDLKRNVLYVTAGDSVLRYDLAGKSFLPPLTLGGDLRGIDISPDNSHLAVADAAGGNGRVRIHVVDLDTENDTPASFTAEFQESGTYSVAYGADGQIWISSSMNGSGSLPMRKYNPPTRSVMKLQRVSQDTMLAASADRQSIGFAEGRTFPGTYGRILYRASQLPPQPMRATNYLYEIAINKDGSQLALPGYQSTTLAGSAVPELDEKQILGAAYHPQRNYLFVSQAGTSQISVYDAANYSKVKDLDFGEPFEWADHAFESGRLKLSQDGFYVFCTVRGGVRYMETGL